MLNRDNFRQYQSRALRWVHTHQHAGLFLDMGLGKTVVTLTAIIDFLTVGELTGPVLLVGPIRVIKTVWRQEAQKWEHTRGLCFSLVHGSAKQRLDALATPADIYLINPENVKWLMELMKTDDELESRFGMLVIDESSMFKDPTTQRFKALKSYIPKVRHRLILTGTPTPNNLMEIWPQVYMTDAGKRLGPSFYRFRDRFFETTDYMGYNWAPRPEAENYIYKLLGDVILRLDAKDWLELPPILDNIVKIELPQEARKLYQKMAREMLIKLDTGDEVEAVNAAVLSGKCQQIAQGAIYADEERTRWELIHDAKLEALREILDGAGGNVLVVYQYRHDLDRLKAAYPHAPVFTEAKDPETLVREWNAGKHPIMFLHPGSGGHGLNLQYGGNRIVFFSLTWSLERHDQVTARIGPARQVGIADNVIRHYIVAENTVDEVIMAALAGKAQTQKMLLDMLRGHAQKVVA